MDYGILSEREEARADGMSYTPGPWRVRRARLDPDNPSEPPACYGIVAGTETWHDNRGHFHPADARYPIDEVHVVEIGYDRDYQTPEAAIPREADARLIAAAPDLYEALKALVAASTQDWTADDWVNAEPAISAARAALAKVEEEK